MAPLEIEYGKISQVDGRDVFIHDDTINPDILEKAEKGSRTYFVWEQRLDYSHKGIIIKLNCEVDSEDKGGMVKYRFSKLRLLFWMGKLQEATLTVPEGTEVVRKVEHPNDPKLKAGLRVKHVLPKPEAE